MRAHPCNFPIDVAAECTRGGSVGRIEVATLGSAETTEKGRASRDTRFANAGAADANGVPAAVPLPADAAVAVAGGGGGGGGGGGIEEQPPSPEDC